MLDPLQKNAVLSTCLHIEGRLTELQALLAQDRRPSPLDPYINDVSSAETEMVADYFDRIRAAMVSLPRKTWHSYQRQGASAFGGPFMRASRFWASPWRNLARTKCAGYRGAGRSRQRRIETYSRRTKPKSWIA